MTTPVQPRPDTPLLQARALRCAVAGRVLWQDLHLCVGAGERWAVTGASGTGKTLLLRTLAGLAPLQAGALSLCGRPWAHWSAPAWRARAMYVPQRPVLPEGTVRTALAAPFALRAHRGTSFSEATARQHLQALGLAASFLQQQTADLSGGEAQAAALVRALLLAPQLLLLDEPTASLDAARTARVELLVSDWLAAAPGRASIWSSHDAAQLARVSDQALALGDGA